MPVSDLINQGVSLMLLGMGSVFAFLLLLILSMKLMSWLSSKISNETAPKPLMNQAHTSQILSEQVVISVIKAAIDRYKKDHHV